MCGLIGIISKQQSGFYAPQADLFEEMFVANTVRGLDSTGAFLVTRKNAVRVIKHETHPLNLIATDSWKRFRESIVREGRILIGHNRAATKGEISNENAHPFVEDHIVLVHNGTIHNHKSIADTKVDSHAIAIGIKEKGYKETLQKIHGAWALIWYDQLERTLNLTTNADRPLGYLETSDQIFIASELPMLYWLLSRKNIKVKKDSAKYLNKNELIRISVDPFKLESFDITKEIEPVRNFQMPPLLTTNSDAESTSGTTTVVTSSGTEAPFGTYVKDSLIIVYPEDIQPVERIGEHVDGKGGRWRFIGKGYLPNKKLVRVQGLLPLHVHYPEDVTDLMKETKLIGKVLFSKINEQGEEIVVVKDIQTDTWIQTWLGNEIPWDEWEYITKNELCETCCGILDENQYYYTSLKVTAPNKYNISCHKCVEANKADMPPELQAKFSCPLPSAPANEIGIADAS